MWLIVECACRAARCSPRTKSASLGRFQWLCSLQRTAGGALGVREWVQEARSRLCWGICGSRELGASRAADGAPGLMNMPRQCRRRAPPSSS